MDNVNLDRLYDDLEKGAQSLVVNDLEANVNFLLSQE